MRFIILFSVLAGFNLRGAIGAFIDGQIGLGCFVLFVAALMAVSITGHVGQYRRRP